MARSSNATPQLRVIILSLSVAGRQPRATLSARRPTGQGHEIASRSPDPVGALLEGSPQGLRQGLELLARILDAVPAHPQRERGRTVREAPVAPTDGAGADEPLAAEAAVARVVSAPDRVPPVHHQAVAEARPARQRDLIGQC